jgi:hypothetical protein
MHRSGKPVDQRHLDEYQRFIGQCRMKKSKTAAIIV